MALPNVPLIPTGASALDIGWAAFQIQQQKAISKSANKAQVAQAQSAAQVAAYNAQAAIASAEATKSMPAAKSGGEPINWKLLGIGAAAVILGVVLLKKL